jgi:hypothetical protein
MIVGGKNGDSMLFNDMPYLKIRDCHSYSQLPRFIAARDDTAIVIAEHHDWFVPQIGTENSFAGAIKTIAIDDRYHSLQAPEGGVPQPATIFIRFFHFDVL